MACHICYKEIEASKLIQVRNIKKLVCIDCFIDKMEYAVIWKKDIEDIDGLKARRQINGKQKTIIIFYLRLFLLV